MKHVPAGDQSSCHVWPVLDDVLYFRLDPGPHSAAEAGLYSVDSMRIVQRPFVPEDLGRSHSAGGQDQPCEYRLRSGATYALI